MFTFTGAINTDLDRVRSRIPDVIAAEEIFTDERINDFLISEGSVNGAVALALEIIASDEALVQKVVRLGGGQVETDGSKTAEVLIARAKALRDQLVLESRSSHIPVTGQIIATAPVTPDWPPDANDPVYSGTPYTSTRRV